MKPTSCLVAPLIFVGLVVAFMIQAAVWLPAKLIDSAYVWARKLKG